MNIEEKMKNGELYKCDALTPELQKKLYKYRELICDFNNARPSQEKKRSALLKKIFAEIGENCYIEGPLRANWGCNTHIGNNFYANFNLTLVDDTDIYIGNDVMIAPNVTLATAGHPIDPELRAQVYQFNMPIHIGNRVWIGAGAIVMPGVKIGDDSVIGAGSVVTRDIPSGVVAVGNPCRIMREISQRDKEYYFKDRKIILE